MKSGIYKITNTINDKFYIGSSYNLHIRRIQHFSDLRRNRHKNSHLQRAWNKYGEKSFIYEILEECNIEDLIKIEQIYLNNLLPQYNISKIADRPTGRKLTQEQKDKISSFHKGKKLSEDTKRKLSIAHTGIKHTKETKKRISEVRKGIKHSDETKRKLSLIVSKPIIQYSKDNQFIREWNSALEAANSLKVNSGHISSCCNNLRKTAYKYKWKFKNE